MFQFPLFMSGFGYLRNGANDPTGQIRQWTQNHSGLAGPRTLALGYDEVDQLKDATRTETGGAVSGKWSYGYDKSGNRLAALENGMVSQFVANEFNQLTGTATAQKFPVKFAGTTNEPSDVTVGGLNAGTNTQNWSAEVPLGAGANSVEIRATETTSIAPGTVAQTTVRRAQLTLSASPARGFAYDLNGSTTTDGLRTYEWDAANRLRAIVTAGSTVKRTEFTYDGGNRWVKLVEKETNVVVGSREVIWEGASIAQLRLKNAAGTETERRTFYGGGEVRTVGATTTALLETSDHLGNVRELLDTTGTVRARYDYDVYGKRTKISGDLASDFGFTGHYEHTASALTLAPFRAYDSVMGRWISRDPIEESGGLNLYGYVGGNVAGATDPLGWAGDHPGGHHVVVRQIWKFWPSHYPARAVFSQFTIPVTSNHKWNASHMDYNEAVWEKWDDFKKANKISDSTCSKAQARKFLSQVMKSKDTRIGGFFPRITTKGNYKRYFALAAILGSGSAMAAETESLTLQYHGALMSGDRDMVNLYGASIAEKVHQMSSNGIAGDIVLGHLLYSCEE